MKLALEKKKPAPNQLHWKACLPFVENKRGVLIHRPRNATTYSIHRKAREAPPFRAGRDRAARVACHVVAVRIITP